MNLESLIVLTLKISIALNVIALGLEASLQDASSLFRRPGLLLRSLLSMTVVMPLVAAVLIAAFNLNPVIKIALAAISVSPVPPILPRKQLHAGGSTAYTFGLLVAASALAVLTIPLSLEIFGKVFGKPTSMTPGAVAATVFTTVLVPLAAGMLIRVVAPGVAGRMAKGVALVGMVLLALGILPVLFKAMPAMVSLVGNGTLLAFAAFVIVGLATGHLLGGPESEDRTVLALSTAARHPGVALAIVHVNYPEAKLAAPAVLLYLLMHVLLSIPYLAWRRRHRATGAPTVPIKASHA